MGEIGRFYKTESHAAGTHLGLRWNGRVRFTVPRQNAAQEACWMTFRPGRLELGLRATARFPLLFGSTSCIESDPLASLREFIGNEAGISCCRAGTPGPWSKETILFLDKNTIEPMYIVKAGTGQAVDLLLQNEAHWLRTLRNQAAILAHIPEIVLHHSAVDNSFVAERPLKGHICHGFGEMHIEFLKKLHDYSQQTMWFEESTLYRKMRTRLANLKDLLSPAWSDRLNLGMHKIRQSMSEAPIVLVAAHNDFTPWNIRVDDGIAKVFDWEYADYEQLSLFDPLHFFLLPMALNREPLGTIVRQMLKTMQLCRERFGARLICKPEIQSLAYLVNLCMLYLWSVRETPKSDPVVESYAKVIDYLCRTGV
jgi:hypothetical protein